MPRPKRPPPSGGRGTGRGPAGGGKRSLETPFIPFADASILAGNRPHNFTLQAEAINTNQHQMYGVSDQRLRYTKVNFISAGDLEPSKLENSEAAMAEMSLDSPPTNLINQQTEPPATSNRGDLGPLHEVRPLDRFIIDTQGTLRVITGLPPPEIRSQSPTPSSSSDEVILFGGRDETGRGIQRSYNIFGDIASRSDTNIKIVKDNIEEQMALHATAREAEDKSACSELERPSVFLKPLPELPMEVSTFSKKKKRRSIIRREHRRQATQVEDDDLIADYIANMEELGLDYAASFTHRELGGMDSDLWQETDGTSEEPSAIPVNSNSWNSAELCDFDGGSTSEEILGPVHALLSKRKRPSGTQYLVEWEGHSVDEARWIPQERLADALALAHISKYEADEVLKANFYIRGDDGDSESETDSKDDKEVDESDKDERDQRRAERMTDEKIAQLLSKQEELGLGSDELVLFDDSADGEPNGVFNFRYSSKPTRPRKRSSKGLKGGFPAAAPLADSYDGFDIMDFDRPSLKKKPKRRKGKLAFDLSDSELEASMQMAWENDREKKREKRKERDELRTQGLLAKKQQKPDLKSKYKEGMGIHAVKDEIKNFLMGNNTTLALPPMDKADRKIVHELANLFSLKSKSIGSAQGRFPVLYRTSRTAPYVESAFAAVEHRLTRRFLPRLDLKAKGGLSMSTRSGRGGFGSAGVSYRDGDVVGGSAPELGIENKGRAMLEKMGWSTGTALGALNNKGILEPVSHVVKTTKAGLG